jgi:hypothetical protein
LRNCQSAPSRPIAIFKGVHVDIAEIVRRLNVANVPSCAPYTEENVTSEAIRAEMR